MKEGGRTRPPRYPSGGEFEPAAPDSLGDRLFVVHASNDLVDGVARPERALLVLWTHPPDSVVATAPPAARGK